MRTIRVLVVEDEPLVRWGMAQALSARGCTVVEALDARSMMRVLMDDGEPVFDVVLLDFRLPDSHDLAPLATVRRLSPATQVIMLSAHMPPEIADEALRLGARAVLSKPFDLDDLCARVLGLPEESS